MDLYSGFAVPCLEGSSGSSTPDEFLVKALPRNRKQVKDWAMAVAVGIVDRDSEIQPGVQRIPDSVFHRCLVKYMRQTVGALRVFHRRAMVMRILPGLVMVVVIVAGSGTRIPV